MKRSLPLLLVLLWIAFCVPLIPVDAADEPRHAPNLYIDWPDRGTYDIITIDWYCEKNAPGTYWAVHNWTPVSLYTGQTTGSGYAGFQTLGNGDHVLLMSLWNLDDGREPSIVYAAGGYSGFYDHEGSGGQVFTNYDWQVETWYTMRIQAWDQDGASYFAQWIKEENGDWMLTAVLSYPVTGLRFNKSSVFQEDFVFNNERRRCRVKNAYGRFAGTDTWDSWSTGTVSSSYFPTLPEEHDDWSGVQLNINFSCDTGAGKNYIWLDSGGGDFTRDGHYLPAVFTVTQKARPRYTKWRSFSKALKRIEIERPVNANIFWPKAKRAYDILALDFYCRHDAPSSDYYTHLWRFGSSCFQTDGDGEHAIVLTLDPKGSRQPELYFINDAYGGETNLLEDSLEIRIDYPWEMCKWYTVRLQTWQVDEVAYIGQWIAEEDGAYELLAVAAYDKGKLDFKDIFGSLHSTEKNTETREMRVRNAYGRVAVNGKWEHWEKYRVETYGYDDEFKATWKVKNNIETKRKSGSVRLKAGGDKLILFQRDYPFTFRIPDEDAEPKPANFIDIGLPEEIKPQSD